MLRAHSHRDSPPGGLMPRPELPSPAELARVGLSGGAYNRLAGQLGLKELPQPCRQRIEECLARHVESERAERERKDKAAAGHVEAAIARACKTLEELVSLDSGIDAESLRVLRPHAKTFITAGRDRIRELLAMPRAYTHHVLLRVTCPSLRSIFQQHAQPGFNTRAHLRLFTFEALTAAKIVTPGIDATHLDRLDEYLDARPQPLR
jgi:hypothetical protein